VPRWTALPLACLAALVCAGGPALGAPAPRANVVLVSLCSIRPDHMSAYGYARETTPSLRALAGESIVFEHAFTPWPKTVPAFAALLTAKYAHSTGVMRITPRQHLADEHRTLAEVLADAGYATAAFLSTPALVSTTNIAQGFHTVDEVWRQPAWWDLPSERALAWIRRQRLEHPDQPFLVWAHYNHAHYPYHGGGADPDMFVDDAHYDPRAQVKVHADRKMRLSLGVPTDHFAAHQILRPDIGGVHYQAILRPRPTELAFYLARYDAGIFGADRAVGRLLAGLRDLGLLGSTIVVVVGDHGESLGDHNYYFEHGRFPYDATARVPLLVRLPGPSRARRIDAPASTLGLMPTVLDALGVAAPSGVDGASLLPAIEGGEPPAHVYTESGFQMDYALSVRDRRWKLIHVPNPVDRQLQRGTEWELYDWRADPGETRNEVAAHPEEAERLRRALRAWAAPWRETAYARAPSLTAPPDEAAVKRLRALGYIGDAPRPSRP